MGLDTPCPLTFNMDVTKSRFLFHFQLDLHVHSEFYLHPVSLCVVNGLKCGGVFFCSKRAQNWPLYTDHDATEIA